MPASRTTPAAPAGACPRQPAGAAAKPPPAPPHRRHSQPGIRTTRPPAHGTGTSNKHSSSLPATQPHSTQSHHANTQRTRNGSNPATPAERQNVRRKRENRPHRNVKTSPVGTAGFEPA